MTSKRLQPYLKVHDVELRPFIHGSVHGPQTGVFLQHLEGEESEHIDRNDGDCILDTGDHFTKFRR